VLSRYYIHHGETAAELNTLARTAKHLMNHVMRDLGPVLTALPVGPSHPGQTAGPTFDIARPAIFLLPHQDAAWKFLAYTMEQEGNSFWAQKSGYLPGNKAVAQEKWVTENKALKAAMDAAAGKKRRL